MALANKSIDVIIRDMSSMNAQRTTVLSEWNGVSSAYPSEEGLEALFAKQVQLRPEAIAVEAEAQRLTYSQLDRRASQMAHLLREHGVGRETPVGVFMGPRIEQIVAQVAICKAGGTYVPLDPSYPRARLEFMMADAGVAVVLTEGEPLRIRLGEQPHINIDTECLVLDQQPEVFTGITTDGGHRTHILYTSGSTGNPKGIEIVTRAVSRVVIATNYIQLEPTDRIAQIANFSFDAAIFEVWGGLLNGVAIVIVPRDTAVDPCGLQAAIVRAGITVMFLTTSLFNLVAQTRPDTFGTLRVLIVGGEKHNAAASRAVLAALRPRHLVHAYGPTESTIFAVTCELDAAKLATDAVPIGRPIANTQVFILDEARRAVGVGEVGELYIGGDGLARGYLGQPELTQERFVMVAGLGGDGERRLYRTGDQARWRADGLIEYVGRIDFQVKIRGFRIELEEVEVALVGSGMLTEAIAAVREGVYGDKVLVAHVVPRDAQTFQEAELRAYMRAKVPPYMIPGRIDVIGEMPLNVNGKIDRKALIHADAQPGVSNLALLHTNTRDPLTIELGQMWAELLGVNVVSPESDFFDLGGSSLLAARLVLRVRDTYGIQFPIYSLYASATLRDFAAVVERARRGVPDFGTMGTSDDGPDVWRADARLPADVRDEIVQSVSRERAGLVDGVVFLTGGTGFLGAFLLRDLLRHTQARVCCLVRAADENHGVLRLRAALEKYDLWESGFAGRICAVPGDLGQRRFGLSEDTFNQLASSLDVIIHNGAQVSYVQPYVAHRQTNVMGTSEVLRLAAAGGRTPVHHVSTIAVFGPSGFLGGKKFVSEDEDLDEYVDDLAFDIGYSASKWVGEKLVWEAGRLGLPVAVYRPGFIMGDSRSGAGNMDDFVGRLVRGVVQVGAYPELPRQRKEFVPVDYVSGTIIHIAGKADCLGRAYHLVPPDPLTSVDLGEFFTMITKLGYPMVQCDYGAWVERLIEDSRVRDNPLSPLLPMLFEQVREDGRTRWELYEDMSTFGATNTIRALAGSGIQPQPMGELLLAKYLRYWNRTGELPPPRTAGRSSDAQRRAVATG